MRPRRTASLNSASKRSHVGRKDVPVHEEILLRKPFGQLKHFYREGVTAGRSC